jgi:NADH:ubiquinone oxidoreductase subunit 5 (subunit L)/multisubunit Na+/H+ antiporter MnhA subunit
VLVASGKRVGARRKRRFDAVLLLLAVAVTACMVAWGYLVKSAIDFGVTARGGESDAWLFLGLASLGAVACLFVGLILVAKVFRRLTKPPTSDSSPAPNATTLAQPRIPGGRRAMR